MDQKDTLPRTYRRVKIFMANDSGIDERIDGKVNEWIEANGVDPLSIELKVAPAFGSLYAVIMVTYEEIVPAE